MNKLQLFFTTLILAIVILILSVFTVPEAHNALVSRFGKFNVTSGTQAVKVYGPGLHFKIPLIEQIHFFDGRLRLQNIQSSPMTSEKKLLLVDLFIKWRIKDLEKFYNTTDNGKVSRAESLLQQKISDGVRAEFTHRTVKNVIAAERLEIMKGLLDSTKAYAKNLGIEVVDARIKRIEFPDTVKQDVYKRMSTERKAEADRLRATGESQANTIRAEAEAQTRIEIAGGRKSAQEIRGQGDAQAAMIYAEAYNKNMEFFEFYRSMLAYEVAFSSKQDLLVLRPESEFFKFFK